MAVQTVSCAKSMESKKRQNRNMFSNSSQTSLCIIVAATFVLLLKQQCLAESTTETTLLTTNKPAYGSVPTTLSTSAYTDDYRECLSMDVRNFCDSFEQLENCTVITGYLLLVLVSDHRPCNFDNLRYPKLREVTDFILIYDLKNLVTFRTMFPNLTVIRGRRVFQNYAIGIMRMPAMTALEFPSLVAIQRGHVYASDTPLLCNLHTINFDRLTLTPGENHIIPENITECPKIEHPCMGCDSGYCWSNKVCQKFENDNILNLQQGIQHCDAQCLGGCVNRTAQGCAACRSWMDHRTCVEKCPDDKYASEHYMRCYTREECIAKRLLVYKNECISDCPSGYKLNNITRECDSCGGINTCPKVCYPPPDRDNFGLFALSDIEVLKGCQILDATVLIFIRYRINEQELMDSLKDVREISGFLKIYDSPHLTSLKFFENLEKIHGKTLEHDHYALILYNNPRIEDIWPLKKNLELVKGGMSISQNERLCNRIIRNFKTKVKHDHSLDSIILSDLEVLCSPEKLILGVEAISHRSFKLSWLKDETTDEVEILYQPIAGNKPFVIENNKFDIPVCERIHWQRELAFSTDLPQNNTHYSYTVDNLEPHTKYRCVVKTFGKEEMHEARSEMKLIITKSDIPTAPHVMVYKKSFESLSVQWYYDNREDEFVDFYRLEVYEIPDKTAIIDQRDYCGEPMKLYPDFHNEDYDDCCSRRQEDMEDDLFKKQLKQEFACSVDQKEYCERNSLEDSNVNNDNALLTKRLEHRETNYTIRSLERFHTYTLQIQACNHAGCGAFSIITERTNYSLAADKMYDLTACKKDDSNEYRVHFKEPKKPNGVIISYALHFRNFDATQGPYLSHMHCLTRLEHERNKFLYVGHLNETFNQIAVRVESLGHHLFTDWMDINKCSGLEGLASEEDGGLGTNLFIFLICCIVGCAVLITVICYRRKCWSAVPPCGNYVSLPTRWGRLVSFDSNTADDRQILVESFDTVRFINMPEEYEY